MELPVLEPAIEIPLVPDASGAVAYPTVSFDDAASRVFLTAMRPIGDRYGWWHRNECEVGAITALVSTALLVWVVIHVRRRPQRTGHVYCSHCNYDLTPATPVPESSAPGLAMEAGFSTTVNLMHFDALPPVIPAVCPECGVKTHDHPPAKGRTTRRRLAWPVPVLLLLLVAGTWRCGHWLTLAGASSLPRWPMDFVGKLIPGWPVARLPYSPRQMPTVTAFSLKSPAGGTGVTLQYDAIYAAAPTTDGRRWVWVEFGESNGWKNELCWHDFETGLTRRVELGSASDGFGTPQGFTSEGREALAIMTGLVTPGAGGKVDGTTMVRLVGVDLTTGKVREIGKAKSASTQTAPDSWQVPAILGAARESGDPEWAILTLDGPAAGAMTVGTGGESREVRTSAVGNAASNSSLSFDAKEGLILTNGSGPARIGWKIGRDGTAAPLAAPTVRWSAVPGGKGMAITVDGSEKALLAAPGMPSSYGSVVFSPDGKWVALVATKPGPPPSGFSGSVLVWDLSKIPE